MWSTIKAIPVLPKIVLGSLLLLALSALSHRSHNQPAGSNRWASDDRDQRQPRFQRAAQPSAASEAELAQQYLAKYQARQAQVQAQAQACTVQMQQMTNQYAIAAMNGQMPMGQAPCQQYMPQLIAEEAFLEGQIYRLQSGDYHSSLTQITGVQVGGTSAGSYYHPENDGGLSAVERYDRQAIRGTSIYADEDGEQHELQTQPYYYRNRSTGDIIHSNQPNPPNDGRDYERFTAQE